MPYITKSNARKILEKIELTPTHFQGKDIYERKIYCFNALERTKLLQHLLFYSEPDSIIGYVKIKSQDNFRFVFEGGQSAYHDRPDCEKMTGAFFNVEVPNQIKKAGEDKIIEFRNWFKKEEIKKLYLNNKKDFLIQLRKEFSDDTLTTPIEISFDNSGVEEIENLDLIGLISEIEYLIAAAADSFKGSDELTKKIIILFDKKTHLASKDAEIPGNHFGIPDDQLRMILREYEGSFKLPLMALLKQYYRVKYNPDLQFKGKLLEQLGFRKCSKCHD